MRGAWLCDPRDAEEFLAAARTQGKQFDIEIGYASNFAIPHAPLFGGGVVVHARRRRGCGSGVIVATRCSNRSSWLAPKNRSAAVVPSSRRRT